MRRARPPLVNTDECKPFGITLRFACFRESASPLRCAQFCAHRHLRSCEYAADSVRLWMHVTLGDRDGRVSGNTSEHEYITTSRSPSLVNAVWRNTYASAPAGCRAWIFQAVTTRNQLGLMTAELLLVLLPLLPESTVSFITAAHGPRLIIPPGWRERLR